MITSNTPSRVRATLGTALATVLALSFATLNPAPAAAQNPAAVTPAETLNLSVGRGSMVRLGSPMTDLFVANDAVADVQVRSSTQLYLFGKAKGETTVYATDKSGRVVFSANVRVGQNISSVDDVLRLAMPDAAIEATPMNGIVLLTGTVASPADVEEAGRIVKAYVGEGTEVVSRLRAATPQQVNLRVKVVEINRTRLKQIGVNLLAGDRDGNFGIARSNRPSEIKTDIFGNPIGRGFELLADGVTSILLNGNVLGLDIRSAIDLSEADGLVTTLAEPNLTALSGETASFLAGGEFPVPISQQFGTVSIEYKQYGVSLAFTPYVLGDGRISMRVRPEVSELSAEGSIRLNGFNVPALTTRRAETTVELGSGQSFMIGGLLRNNNTNNVDKAPFLGDLPIIGALFRSTGFRRAETELVIIVTPYLVKPTSGRLATPADGFRTPTDADRVLLGQTFKGVSGARAPQAAVAPPQTVNGRAAPVARPRGGATTTSTPGFSL